jgi:hypothetical protein
MCPRWTRAATRPPTCCGHLRNAPTTPRPRPASAVMRGSRTCSAKHCPTRRPNAAGRRCGTSRASPNATPTAPSWWRTSSRQPGGCCSRHGCTQWPASATGTASSRSTRCTPRPYKRRARRSPATASMSCSGAKANPRRTWRRDRPPGARSARSRRRRSRHGRTVARSADTGSSTSTCASAGTSWNRTRCPPRPRSTGHCRAPFPVPSAAGRMPRFLRVR